MMRNNKGFSLVELIVALAIFAIVGLALVGFVASSTNNFNRSNEEIGLQYEQQLVVNQVRDIIIESGEGIYYDDTTKLLTIYGSLKQVNDVKKYPVSFVSYKATDKKLYLSSAEFANTTDISYANAGTASLFAEDVTNFSADLSQVKKGKVTFSITFERGGKTKSVTETVALRNTLVVSNDASVIWGDDPTEIESFIEAITISRGVTEFTNGASDEIGKMGEPVEVLYTAKVTANDVSTREYAVKWSLAGMAGPEAEAPTGISFNSGVNEVAVKVENTVATGTAFRLYATSVDDPAKFSYINITVTDTGVYADSMTLALGPIETMGANEIISENGLVELGNGYNGYKLVPTIRYTDNTTLSDYNYFTWKIEVTPLETEQTPEKEEGDTEETPLDVYGFDEKTGRLVLYSTANGRTIKVTATAKERTFKGEIISASMTFTPVDIPEYDPGTILRIGTVPKLSRGGYQQVALQVLNAPEDATYEYKVQVETYYDAGSTQWDGGATNSDFNYISFTDEYDYNEADISHEEDLGENRTINLACSKKLNWSYTFRALLSATATDQEGNVIEADPIIVEIPAVEVLVSPAIYVPTEVDDQMILSDSILQYEDWYFSGLEETDPAAKYCTTRRWFEISFNYLELDDADWASYRFENNYMFMNQIGTPLNERIVTYPTSHTRFADKLTGFTVRLSNWERLANRPVFMNFTVTVSDDYGNLQAGDTQQFLIVYKLYPNQD